MKKNAIALLLLLTSDKGRAANRRVEIKVLNSGDLSRETEVRELIER